MVTSRAKLSVALFRPAHDRYRSVRTDSGAAAHGGDSEGLQPLSMSAAIQIRCSLLPALIGISAAGRSDQRLRYFGRARWCLRLSARLDEVRRS
ncbi:hypothetical protein KCP74_07005 [Salmonella enterica subsp. enterica]|nr:hypothetical protein KCP74_07005 [Salmonella enterica subsp. enterica]